MHFEYETVKFSMLFPRGDHAMIVYNLSTIGV